jgi:hypothetical protein
MVHKNVCFSRLTQQQVAEAMQVSTRTVREWALADLPKNADGSYTLSAVIGWRVELLLKRRWMWRR